MPYKKIVETLLILCYNCLTEIFRELVQLVERRSPKPNVVGSSPAFPAIWILLQLLELNILKTLDFK